MLHLHQTVNSLQFYLHLLLPALRFFIIANNTNIPAVLLSVNLLKEIAVKLDILEYMSEMTDLMYACVTEIDHCLLPDMLDVLCILAVKVNNHEIQGSRNVEIQISNRCLQSLITENSPSNQFVVVTNPLGSKKTTNDLVPVSLFKSILLTETDSYSPLLLFASRVLNDFVTLALNENLIHPTLLTVRTVV